ncbi:TPA: inovirus-type Gp2 protein [Burkholderia multivorans]|nr:inovirus-type Gp2 protein [Burkholderia multivorans]
MNHEEPIVQEMSNVLQQNTRYWEKGEYQFLSKSLTNLLEGVLETDHRPFAIKAEQWARTPGMSGSGYSLTTFLPYLDDLLDLCEPQWYYASDFQLFFDCYRSHEISRISCRDHPEIMGKQGLVIARTYNDFIEFMRHEAIIRRVRKSLLNKRDGLKQQRLFIRRNLEAWSAQYDVLLPVRVDLFYTDNAVVEADLLPRMKWRLDTNGQWIRVPSRLPSTGVGETRARIDPVAAMADRERFFENQNGADRGLFEDMVGYVWKMEQGGRHGAHHFHCLFLFDGVHVKTGDVNRLVTWIGERWGRVTGNLGLLFNCHLDAYRDKWIARDRWALGQLRKGDVQQLEKLLGYLEYFTEEEKGQMIRAKPTLRANTLTMGRAKGFDRD